MGFRYCWFACVVVVIAACDGETYPPNGSSSSSEMSAVVSSVAASSEQVPLPPVSANSSSSSSAVLNSSSSSESVSHQSSSSESSVATLENIALLATASTSYVSPWETIDALNDGATPANSGDKSQGAYGNWNNPDSWQWVQYRWQAFYKINKIEIYWFDDTGGVLVPSSAFVQRWNGSAWEQVKEIPLQKDTFNTVNLDDLVADRLRVTMTHPQQSTGMLEWRVYGVATEAPVSSSSSSSSVAPTEPASCSAFQWPGYNPDLDYDFRDEYKNIDPSNFKVHLGCDESLVAGVKTSGWFAFIWGHNRNPEITDEDIDRVLANLNEDMAYARDVMGWPPDRLPRDGYYSNVYLFGSGLCTDNAANTDRGGWQSAAGGYPMVLLSYYPVVTPTERGGITHEAIHAVLASMPAGKAAWFNEGSNTWLQMSMEADRTGGYGVGFLDGVPFLAPHIPIENYSGWLQDGSFGGPNAEGVNLFENGQQISTWRNYLGGHQYNSVFSHFLAQHVSLGANAWIWSNPDHNQILKTLESGLGEQQVRHLIMEYRARQALVDFGDWSDAFKVQINNFWGITVTAEATGGGVMMEPAPHRLTPYAATTQVDSTLVPEPETLPGWSGANQIPLKVNGNTVRVNFEPYGQNMRMQLVYRAEDGSAVYSQPTASGEVCLNLDKAPKDGVVTAVVSNTDYLYEGDETRKRKYDYRLHLQSGVEGTAPIYDKHF